MFVFVRILMQNFRLHGLTSSELVAAFFKAFLDLNYSLVYTFKPLNSFTLLSHVYTFKPRLHF